MDMTTGERIEIWAKRVAVVLALALILFNFWGYFVAPHLTTEVANKPALTDTEIKQIMASVNTCDLFITRNGYICPIDVEVKSDGSRDVWSHCGQGPAQAYDILNFKVVHNNDPRWAYLWSKFVRGKLAKMDCPKGTPEFTCDAK